MSAGFSTSRAFRRIDGKSGKGSDRFSAARPPYFVVNGSPHSAPPLNDRNGRPSLLSKSPPIHVAPGRIGDHPNVYQLLQAVFQAPSRQEFQAQQDDPLYEPTDRLIVKRADRAIAHLLLTKRMVRYGGARLPAAGVQWLGTLPEFRCHGFASRLLRAADGQMIEDGAVLSFLRTNVPHFFKRFGWAVCGRHSYSRAKPRDVLSRLSDAGYLRRSDLNLRFWRHVELPALMRIYQQNVETGYGPLDRGDAYWRWLISRRAYDHIIVALNGPDKLELDETTAPIVGYAVIRGRQIVELLTDPAYPDAAPQLLARACGDLIEHDDRPVTLHVAAESPLHRYMTAAGGTQLHHESDQGEVHMVKILDYPRLAKSLAPDLLHRAREQRLPRPCELGFLVEGDKHQFVLTARGAKWNRGRLGRSFLTLNHCDLTRLLLGHLDVNEAVVQGRIAPSTHLAEHIASILFPKRPLWRPAWDDMPS